MKIERVLSTLEEYLELRREAGEADGDHTVVQAAKERAGLALNEYIRSRFDNLMIEERRVSSTPTRKVDIVNPATAQVSWEEVAELMDALNAAPVPMRDLTNPIAVHKWTVAYKSWYENKRRNALSVNPTSSNSESNPPKETK